MEEVECSRSVFVSPLPYSLSCRSPAASRSPSAGAAGAAGVMYHEGRLVDKVNAPIDRAYDAALSTLAAKKLAVSSKSADIASAHIKSKYADGKELWIDIEAITSEVCEIKIRVGITGDQDRAIDLLEGIKSRL